MLAKRTIKAKILELCKGKEGLLRCEYENWQHYLHGDKDAPLYSTTKQQQIASKRLGEKLKPDKEYPLIPRRDVHRANTRLAPYWLKIPIYDVGAE